MNTNYLISINYYLSKKFIKIVPIKKELLTHIKLTKLKTLIYNKNTKITFAEFT